MSRATPQSRAAVLERNVSAIAARQPALAAGLRELGAPQLDALRALDLPVVDEARMQEFARSTATQSPGDVLVLLGLGSPHMISTLRQALPADRGLIVVEPTLELGLRLLSQHDFHDVLSDEYTAVVMAGDDRSLQQQLELLITAWGVAELQLVVNPMRPLGGEVAALVGDMLRGALRSIELATATGAKYGETAVANIAGNLAQAAGARDLTALSGAYKGVPAFVIGAGPSLNDVRHLLGEAKARGVVIACDAALPVLLEAGVTPDIVVTLDIADIKAGVFEQCYAKDALLVALLAAHPRLVRAWIGPRSFAVDDHPLARWAAAHLTPPGSFGSLGNVAHLGFGLARAFGCDPVVLCGVDYALARDGGVYAAGVLHDAPRKRADLPKEQVDALLEVVANDGQQVTTLRNMAVYADALSGMARAAGGQTITTALAGAKMESVGYMALEDVLAELPEREVARPMTGQQPEREVVESRKLALRKALGALETELRTYAADANEFSQAVDAAGAKLGKPGASLDEHEIVRALQPQLEAFSRHRAAIDLIEPLQPAVTYEINRLTRRTRGMADAIVRARTRLLALAGPAAGGAALAEFTADRLRGARLAMM